MNERIIQDLLEGELAKVRDPSRRLALEALLVRPQPLMLKWDYGKPGEQFPCWLVGLSPDRSQRLVYCQNGFGPVYPWGIIGMAEDWMGMDCDWHAGLEHAAICGGLLDAPPGYEVP